MCKDLKLLFLANTLSPYRLAFYNTLAQKHFPFKVVLLAGSEKSREWNLLKDKGQIKFKYSLLPGFQLFFIKKDWPLNFNWGLLKQILNSQAKFLVLTGYESPSYWLALLYAKILKKKIVFWNGSTLESGRSNNFLVNALRRVFIKNSDAYLAYGTQAKDFLIHYGAKPQKIVISCNTVDIDYFARQSSILASKKDELKKEKKFPAKLILFSALLIPRKNLDVLLKVFKEIVKDDIGLVVLGHGPLKNKYIEWCRKNNLKNVFFEGHRPTEDLPKYYAIADILVMPSLKEVWGLVVNEAMACGLPVLCSNKAGVAKDLVKDSVNGYTFAPEDIDDLKSKLTMLLRNEKKRKDMGNNSLQIINNCTLDKYTEHLLKAVDLAVCYT